MAKKLVPARVLVELLIEGRSYKPNQLVSFPPALVESLAAGGSIDCSKGAVAYCRAEGVEQVEHDVEAPAADPVDPADLLNPAQNLPPVDPNAPPPPPPPAE